MARFTKWFGSDDYSENEDKTGTQFVDDPSEEYERNDHWWEYGESLMDTMSHDPLILEANNNKIVTEYGEEYNYLKELKENEKKGDTLYKGLKNKDRKRLQIFIQALGQEKLNTAQDIINRLKYFGFYN